MPYVKLPLIVTVYLLTGLGVGYLFLTIVSVYTLAALVGAPTLQLVIGAISATSALVSASAAFLVYRNSIRGAEIAVELEDQEEVAMEYRIKRTLASPSQVPTGASQELFEKLGFKFEVVLMNIGPRGGTMTDIDLKLVKPLVTVPTIRDGGIASVDKISISWEMQVVTRETYRPTIFRSGRKNSVSLASNESIVLVAGVDMLLMDQQNDRPPFNNWLGIQQRTPYFEFKLQWRTATKGGLKPNARSFTIRPKFGQPIIMGPSITVP